MKREFEKYCKEPENIENYEKAKKDNFKGWECHHRLETHNSDGVRRPIDIPKKKLIALGMYYNRPASELIFLTIKEHHEYRKGKKHSEEARNKMSEAKKNMSEETKKKMSEAKTGEKHPMYGKHHSEEARKKMREAKKGNTNVKGRYWYNNGKISKRAYECPPGFVPGRLR